MKVFETAREGLIVYSTLIGACFGALIGLFVGTILLFLHSSQFEFINSIFIGVAIFGAIGAIIGATD